LPDQEWLATVAGLASARPLGQRVAPLATLKIHALLLMRETS
jgi:hypothetical protein